MKNVLLLALLFSSFSFCYAQDNQLPDYSSIHIEIERDYNSEANNAALKAAKYILSTPVNNENINYSQSSQYLIKWMTGTPHYSFEVGPAIGLVAEHNPKLLVCTMAAMAEYLLEHDEAKVNYEHVRVYALTKTVEYALDEKNNITPNGEFKNAIAAYKKGKSKFKKYVNKIEFQNIEEK